MRCYRIPRFADELARCRAINNRSGFLELVAQADLLVLDDFGLAPMTDEFKRDLLEILDDRPYRFTTPAGMTGTMVWHHSGCRPGFTGIRTQMFAMGRAHQFVSRVQSGNVCVALRRLRPEGGVSVALDVMIDAAGTLAGVGIVNTNVWGVVIS